MTVAGDMAAYVDSTTPGIDMPTARIVIALALEAANDPNFALRFAREYEWDHGFEIYYDVIKFLQDMNH
jgi:hypothetical protein